MQHAHRLCGIHRKPQQKTFLFRQVSVVLQQKNYGCEILINVLYICASLRSHKKIEQQSEEMEWKFHKQVQSVRLLLEIAISDP